jgi:hypothetical protein
LYNAMKRKIRCNTFSLFPIRRRERGQADTIPLCNQPVTLENRVIEN